MGVTKEKEKCILGVIYLVRASLAIRRLCIGWSKVGHSSPCLPWVVAQQLLESIWGSRVGWAHSSVVGIREVQLSRWTKDWVRISTSKLSWSLSWEPIGEDYVMWGHTEIQESLICHPENCLGPDYRTEIMFAECQTISLLQPPPPQREAPEWKIWLWEVVAGLLLVSGWICDLLLGNFTSVFF